MVSSLPVADVDEALNVPVVQGKQVTSVVTLPRAAQNVPVLQVSESGEHLVLRVPFEDESEIREKVVPVQGEQMRSALLVETLA